MLKVNWPFSYGNCIHLHKCHLIIALFVISKIKCQCTEVKSANAVYILYYKNNLSESIWCNKIPSIISACSMFTQEDLVGFVKGSISRYIYQWCSQKSAEHMVLNLWIAQYSWCMSATWQMGGLHKKAVLCQHKECVGVGCVQVFPLYCTSVLPGAQYQHTRPLVTSCFDQRKQMQAFLDLM